MKLKFEILCSPKEFEEIFTPNSDTNKDFRERMFEAYTAALQNAMKEAVAENFDPTKLFNVTEEKSDE